MKGSKTWRRLALWAAVAAAAALAAGVGAGQAATSFTITLTQGIGTGANDVPTVSVGGEIGYHLFVQNTGDSNTTHVTIVVTSDTATFLDAGNPLCVANPQDAHQAICTPADSTMNSGASFASDLRFTAPASGTSVTTSAAVTVAAQTVGGTQSGKATILVTSDPAETDLVSGEDVTATFLRGNEPASTGELSSSHTQHFGLTLPPGLLGSPFAVAVSIRDQVGTPPDCGDFDCLASFTTLSIPLAATLDTDGNPFYDGTNLNAYSWTMTALYPPGFKLTGILHDGAEVPSCADVGGAPSAADPLCWDTLVQTGKTKTLSATGRGLENGNLGFH